MPLDAVVAMSSEGVSALAAVLGVLVTFLVALAGGVWSVSRWIAERRATREQEERLARERLAQAQVEEQHRRQDKAAELVLSLGDASDRTARLWTASALALYPDETLPLLINAFGHADPETAAAIKLALTSVGPDAIEPLCRMNRVARTIVSASTIPEAREQREDDPIELAGAQELLRCTRSTIAYLLFQTSEDERRSLDLVDVDLSEMNFANANLRYANFRKARLTGAVFARAKLGNASFRGASVEGSVFTRASAASVDLTGARGTVGAIRLAAPGAVLQDVHFDGSAFEAARFHDATFLRASLKKVTMMGGDLSGASIERSYFDGIDLTQARLVKAHLVDVNLTNAVLRSARMSEVRFEDCRLARVDATGAVGRAASFVNCNLAGASLERMELTGATFVRCNLSGARFDHAALERCRFERCKLYAISFANANMGGAVFAGGNKLDARKIRLDGSDWERADSAADAEVETAFREWQANQTATPNEAAESGSPA